MTSDPRGLAIEAPSARLPRGAIFTPAGDTLAMGGASIIFLAVLLSLPVEAGRAVARTRLVALDFLLNWPHFIASFVLLYGSRETLRQHRWAAVHVPIVLVAYAVFAIAVSGTTRLYLDLAGLVAASYLAVHYTGQAWGMVATSAYLEGVPLQTCERRLVRASLWIFLAWQVAWTFHFFGVLTIREDGPAVQRAAKLAFKGISYLTPVAVLLGVAGFARLRWRTGRALRVRVVAPWLAICIWYAALARYPISIYWIQLSHALQYLLFPLRVESNRFGARAGPAAGAASPRTRALHMAIYTAGLLGAGWVLFEGVSLASPAEGPLQFVPFMVSNVVNIHHYFTDGVVWKLRNPAVRRELFAHLA